MAITVDIYKATKRIMFTNRFDIETFVYAAQLVSGGYSYDREHSTRADITAFTISQPVVLTGKSITRTGSSITLDCNDIVFTSQDAAYCVIHLMNTGSPKSTDELFLCLTLNEGKTESVSTPIILSDSGLITVS